MELSIPIPPDIIHAIVNELRGDNHTLRATSLVARSFLNPSQRCLFSRIILRLDDPDRAVVHVVAAQRLFSAFESSPHLASFARELILMLDTRSLRRDSRHILCRILARLTRLQAATLNLYGNWETQELTLRNAITNLCQLDSLTELSLSGVFRFPAAILMRLAQLKRLNLEDATFIQAEDVGAGASEGGDVERDRCGRGQLEVLEVGQDLRFLGSGITVELFEALASPQSSLRLNNLRVLKINSEGRYVKDHIRVVTKLAAKTLKCFIWDTLIHNNSINCEPLYTFDFRILTPVFPADPIDVSAAMLANLRCLVFSYGLRGISSGIPRLNTIWITGALKKMQTKNCLEELILVFGMRPAENTIELEEWASGLDFLLSQGGFQALAKVSIYLTSHLSLGHQISEGSAELLAQKMPALRSSGALTVGYLKTTKDRKAAYEDAISRNLMLWRSSS